MAFFSPHVFSPYATHQQQAEPSFHGLFRLLEDWDNHRSTTTQSQQPAKRPRQRVARRHQPAFTPRFDVQETESAYELHGELPGVQKKDINIEFSDPQTLVIRGHVERSSSTTHDSEGNFLTTSSPARSTAGDDDEEEGVLVSHEEDTGKNQTDARSETGSQRSFKATVEDDTEDQDGTTSASASAAEKDADSAHQQRDANENGTTSSAAGADPVDAQSHAQATKPSSSAKFWISERSVGTFSRTFEFPERIEIDGVSAGLENGVLSLKVPKAKKFGARQISVL